MIGITVSYRSFSWVEVLSPTTLGREGTEARSKLKSIFTPAGGRPRGLCLGRSRSPSDSSVSVSIPLSRARFVLSLIG